MYAISEICRLLDSNPTMTFGNTTEWRIPEATVNDLADSLKKKLTDLGARLYNVDSSSFPFWYVAVRLTVTI